jgi:hypothetical protein
VVVLEDFGVAMSDVSRVRHRLPEIDTGTFLLASRRRCQYGLQLRYLRYEHTFYRCRAAAI